MPTQKTPIEPVEKLTHDQLAKNVDWPQLLTMVKRLGKDCPFYAPRLKMIHSLRSFGEFHGLPFTTKGELLAAQAANPPFGSFLGIQSPDAIVRVHRTSGTTGRPLFIAMSAHDATDAAIAGRRAFRCAGLDPSDVVIHCLNFCMWAGGLTDNLSLEATGATVVPFGVGQTSHLIQTIRDLGVNAISCTPSYLTRLKDVLAEEFHLQPKDLGLTKAFLGGEGGLQNPEVRHHLETTWDIKAIDANYGMADVLSIFGSECEHRQGLHFHGQGIIHLELINPATLKSLPVEDGAVGEMVLTNLTRECQPLLRFRTGDVIQVTGTGLCPCGRSSLRFVVKGRSDQMVVVRGVNVFPGAVKNLLLGSPNLFTGEFLIELPTPPPHDKVILSVELHSMVTGSREVQSRLEQDLRDKLHFSPKIVLLKHGEIPRTQEKTKYVIRNYPQ